MRRAEDWERKRAIGFWIAGFGLRIADFGSRGVPDGLNPKSAIQNPKSKELVQHILHRRLHAGEDRRVALGELAALGLAQLHYEVEEVLGLLGLEGEIGRAHV